MNEIAELNKLAAEKVMGWTYLSRAVSWKWDMWVNKNGELMESVNTWTPATDISQAFMVADKIFKDWSVSLINDARICHGYEHGICCPRVIGNAELDHPALAIMRAVKGAYETA